MNNNISIENKNNPDRGFIKGIFEWIELFALSISVVLIVLACVGRHSPVIGPSMEDSLHQNDVLIISELFYKPKQGDIVVIQRKDLSVGMTYDEPYVKRIIALGGQTIDIDFNTDPWTIKVDGRVPEYEIYATYKDLENTGLGPNNGIDSFPYTVPEGFVFVMGDNRYNSKDSRYIGAVDERFIIGRVICRVFPFDKFGKVN